MSKTRSVAENATHTAETTMLLGADPIKSGFDNAVKTYAKASDFGKDTLEAYVESATIVSKGV